MSLNMTLKLYGKATVRYLLILRITCKHLGINYLTSILSTDTKMEILSNTSDL